MQRVFVGLALVLAVLWLPSARAATIADSFDEWSATGTQSENGWFNGWYNLTADQEDGDGVYQPADFIAFIKNGTVVGDDELNNWDGGAFRLYRDTIATAGVETGPWTTIDQGGGHPNGTNSAPPILVDNPPGPEEHWAIRRWVSDYAGPAYLISDLSKTAAGNGTTVQLYKNGALLDTNLVIGTPGISHWVQSTISVGDIIDFALTPVGIGVDRGDGSDYTSFRLTVSDQRPPDPPDPPLADSLSDWSATGTQGEKNWFNGYFNLTQDDDGVYQQLDFIPFKNTGGPVTPDGNNWSGTQWDLTTEASGPWTELGAGNTHPNGTNSAPTNEEHWTIRRWVANAITETTALELNWRMVKANTGCGDGVTGKLFVNGQEVDSVSIAGGDGVGVDRKFYINAEPGDVIDLALTPRSGADDGCDGSANRLTIGTEIPAGPIYNPGPVQADSVAEFSENQGQDDWFYGYYDQRKDAETGNAEYDLADFIPFLNNGDGFVSDDGEIGAWKDGENHWNGTNWDLLNNGFPETEHGPWTELTATGGHPAANAQNDPEVHWTIRRWVSDFEGEATVTGVLNNAGGGDGTVGRILVDGVEIWSELSDGIAVNVNTVVTLSEGSIVDFVIDPDGAGAFDPNNALATIGLINDGADGSTFSVSVRQRILFIPAGGITGDFNGNGALDAADLDLQAGAMVAGGPLVPHDLNGDSAVNSADRLKWLHDLKKTWVGDSDLNGLFESADFVVAFQAGKYEVAGATATWVQGDWNGDQVFTSDDFVAAFADGGYEAGPRPGAVSAVPEPTSIMLTLLGLVSLLGVARRRG